MIGNCLIDCIPSPVGNIYVKEQDGAISCLALDKAEIQESLAYTKIEPARAFIDCYFKDPVAASMLELKLNPEGTAFQKKVWQILRTIKPGKLLSYSELAIEVGNKNSQRAVANACSKNPVLIINPCHRVVRKNGALGGFRAGIQVKSSLLHHEKLTLH